MVFWLKSFSYISSFLQNSQNIPLTASREQPTFEERAQAECQARKLFLQVDARRRILRALHTKGQPFREFKLGELVYYFRRGIKEGSRYGGHWYGLARVLTHEKTSDSEQGNHLGSIAWVAHAGKITRCSPEQLRLCAHDLRHLDKEINGPQDFHYLLGQIANQQKYLDISQENVDDVLREPCRATFSRHSQDSSRAVTASGAKR